MTVATVKLWGRAIGAVNWDDESRFANFEYDAEFRRSGREVAPRTMPLSKPIHTFPALSRQTFHGLPGLLADSLPDDYGNALIDAWFAQQGRDSASFNPVERLCYTGDRGMGALEYVPSTGPSGTKEDRIDVGALVTLAQKIMTKRTELQGSFASVDREDTLSDILRVGTSAGGARPKAIIAWNSETDEVRSGQIKVGPGFSHWLLKFDGVSNQQNQELVDATGYGLIEYAYHRMALAAGIKMQECRLLTENGRNHFMTRRFDRTDDGQKIHLQSLCAMEHFDFRQAGAYSYEQALRTIRKLDISMESVEEQFRRMAFNIVGRNQDDHVKNIAFLMNQTGTWSLSPAFDMTYSYNPSGDWTDKHQMTLNGKRDQFGVEDFKACAKSVSMKRGRAEEILREVQDVVRQWQSFAADAGVPDEVAGKIGRTHRIDIPNQTAVTCPFPQME